MLVTRLAHRDRTGALVTYLPHRLMRYSYWEPDFTDPLAVPYDYVCIRRTQRGEICAHTMFLHTDAGAYCPQHGHDGFGVYLPSSWSVETIRALDTADTHGLTPGDVLRTFPVREAAHV